MINIHDCLLAEREKEESFFLENALKILLGVGVPKDPATSIANSLMELMLSGDRYYHTIVHVNNIFDYVQSEKVELQDRDFLAVLFHDAVYNMGSKTNEQDSADLMIAMLRGHQNVKMESVHQAHSIILETANHLSHVHWEGAHLMMDLDLVGLAQDRGYFDSDNRMINKEVEAYAIAAGTTFPWDKRIDFLKKLLERPTLYHKFTQLEPIARANLEWLIEEYYKMRAEPTGRKPE
jgi:predicted metal-dependent HD superfamily phosphohydrolase